MNDTQPLGLRIYSHPDYANIYHPYGGFAQHVENAYTPHDPSKDTEVICLVYEQGFGLRCAKLGLLARNGNTPIIHDLRSAVLNDHISYEKARHLAAADNEIIKHHPKDGDTINPEVEIDRVVAPMVRPNRDDTLSFLTPYGAVTMMTDLQQRIEQDTHGANRCLADQDEMDKLVRLHVGKCDSSHSRMESMDNYTRLHEFACFLLRLYVPRIPALHSLPLPTDSLASAT